MFTSLIAKAARIGMLPAASAPLASVLLPAVVCLLASQALERAVEKMAKSE